MSPTVKLVRLQTLDSCWKSALSITHWASSSRCSRGRKPAAALGTESTGLLLLLLLLLLTARALL
jgi:hypothetical protein